MTAHYVYRVYDAEDRLIYVGCTSNLFFRLKAHETTSWWADQAEHVTAKVYQDRMGASWAEGKVIREEHPRWNLNGHKSLIHWEKQHYVDFVTSFLNQRELLPRSYARMRRIAEHYWYRYGEEFPVSIPKVAS